MHGRRSAGFTLIEVALAIVVGLLVLVGATLMYQQTIMSSSYSKAREKVQAACGLIEETAAANSGNYPQPVAFETIWGVRRQADATTSPWGGTVGTFAVAAQGMVPVTGWPAAPWTVFSYRNPIYAGSLGYALGNTGATQSATDVLSGTTTTFTTYLVGVWDNQANAPYFPAGGR
jgi:Tfp pilus assembly protein PilE